MIPNPMEMLKTREGAGRFALDAYRRCDGDVDVMTDFLMATVMADLVRHLDGSAPLEIDGQTVEPQAALRALLRALVCKMVAVIESQGEVKH